MKKRLLASFLSLVLILALLPTIAFAAGGGYNGANLPDGPDTSGDIWTVTPENAQYTLDGAYGSIDGKTIHLSQGTYDELVLNRTTKYTGSNTSYYNMEWNGTKWQTCKESVESISALTSQNFTYTREINNVTFTAADGAVVNSIKASSGHVSAYGTYDYVRDAERVNENGKRQTYYSYGSLNNITFDGLTIVKVDMNGAGGTDVNGSEIKSSNEGITFKNCTFVGDSNDMNVANPTNSLGLRITSAPKNVAVENCTFENYFYGIYLQGAEGITINNNVFDNVERAGVSLAYGVGGEITIQENIIKNVVNTNENRGAAAILLGDVAEGSSIKINNNVMTNINTTGYAGDYLVRATSVGNNTTLNLNYNYWDGKLMGLAVIDDDEGEVTDVKSPTVGQPGIISGTFPEDVHEYRAQGYVGKDNGDGTFTVVLADSSGPSTPSNPVDPCTERIGTGWVYDEGVGHCVYKGSGQTIPNTSTK